MTFRTLVFALAIGCGGGVTSNPTEPPDAAPDAAPDADIDAPTVLANHHYVIDSHIIPQSNSQARDLGVDIDGDAVTDNQLGQVMATFAGQGFDGQARATRAVDRGELITLIELGANDFIDSEARIELFTGTNPNPAPCNGGGDVVCRRHLQGTAQFVAAVTPRDPPLVGDIATGVLLTDAGTGRVHVALGLLTGPITFELLGARVKITQPATAGVITNGVIGGAIRSSDIDSMLVPAWAAEYDAVVAADCPGAPPTCGCAGGSQGQSFKQLFDADNDCNITANELRTNSLIQSLLAPDVTIDGQQALSVGIGFSAVAAQFTP